MSLTPILDLDLFRWAAAVNAVSIGGMWFPLKGYPITHQTPHQYFFYKHAAVEAIAVAGYQIIKVATPAITVPPSRDSGSSSEFTLKSQFKLSVQTCFFWLLAESGVCQPLQKYTNVAMVCSYIAIHIQIF